MREEEKQARTIMGVPAMSVVFDSALTVAIIMAAISIGKISEKVENLSQQQASMSARVTANDTIDSNQQVTLGKTEAHYDDILRRLESIDRKLERR